SGKSSLAFDTIYAEGQRRYVESLSAYARQFLEMMQKPDVEHIDGLSPAISIEQKTTSRNPRSTVATVTEIYDYMRLLWARVGVPYSPATGLPIAAQTVSQMVDRVMALPEGTRAYLLAPAVRGRKGEYRKELAEWQKAGFTRVRIDGELYAIEEAPALDKKYKHDIEVVVDRIAVRGGIETRLADSFEQALKLADGLVYLDLVDATVTGLHDQSRSRLREGLGVGQSEPSTDEPDPDSPTPDPSRKREGGMKNTGLPANRIVFSEKFACPVSGFTIESLEPRLFSFNAPMGACPACDGLGEKLLFDPQLVVPNEALSLKQGAVVPWAKSNPPSPYYMQVLSSLAAEFGFSLETPWQDLAPEVWIVILHGTAGRAVPLTFTDGKKSYTVKKAFEGVIGNLNRRLLQTESAWMREELGKFQTAQPCETCEGKRLKPEALSVKVAGEDISTITMLSVAAAVQWFLDLNDQLGPQQQQIAKAVLKEINERLGFLNNVGLDYLNLSRTSGTLSGGESQRIRLASQIGSGLSGVLYVLDEPSIGLHQRDNDRLLETLKRLRDLGNTVIVVEHDEDAIRHADHVVDLGPGAGVHGGQIVAQGTLADILASEESLTGQYLSGKRKIEVPAKRRKGNGHKLTVHGARANNLQNVTVSLPLGTFTCVTGLSGSGKSSLTLDTLYAGAARVLNGARVIAGPHDKITG
ncbi:excinuclease ABC subunit UvrA, partial [Novosphingobium sp.]|uniref:excinuclease ABC subunit UvrA n=1 Tax=Novosphingobium sp. TaxID=1874826 RepID=UPI00286BC201